MRHIETSAEVRTAAEPVRFMTQSDIRDLKDGAARNDSGKLRLCLHRELDDPVHEMCIVHLAHVFVPPHKHIGREESFLVIEGRALLVLFDTAGNPDVVQEVGNYASGLPFYCRIPENTYHCLHFLSEAFVFHEVTQGPFLPESSAFAPFAPPPDSSEAINTFRAFLASLKEVR
ncbi:WbuC family cupin fold metalloprotein [Desulfovibrio sp. TomC]|uniref:WbuC family cupin fold metalloprotein n=1 Tax=Desulfovibrio sp. TomC TaxID=1562888 RepID=UPI00064D72A3|nr:WbuC family cupin fold metalloprotein [Desulfovibrio sp. TomC]